jgi:hypothetical protein
MKPQSSKASISKTATDLIKYITKVTMISITKKILWPLLPCSQQPQPLPLDYSGSYMQTTNRIYAVTRHVAHYALTPTDEWAGQTQK